VPWKRKDTILKLENMRSLGEIRGLVSVSMRVAT
jgi:hypothetical protein